MIRKFLILLIAFMLGLTLHTTHKGISLQSGLIVLAMDENGDGVDDEEEGDDPDDPDDPDDDEEEEEEEEEPPYQGEPNDNLDLPEYCGYGTCLVSNGGQCSCCVTCQGPCKCPNQSCHQYPCVCCPTCKRQYCTCDTP